uniref:Uncharacterized protein n=1 Tax=viral metagenome TaxID=1070528 RepID=A0A6C0EHN6_9ZZZZ
MRLDKLLINKNGKIIVSCILGLGLASLFKKVCIDDCCLIIKSPPEKDIEGSVFKHENKCYTYSPQVTKCPSN